MEAVKMFKNFKKVFCCCLVLLMALSAIPVSAVEAEVETILQEGIYNEVEDETLGISDSTDATSVDEVESITDIAEDFNHSATSTEPSTDSVELILGDATLNGKVDLLDAISTQKFVVGSVEFNDMQKACADTDKNGSINLFDCITIQKYTLGSMEETDIGKPFSYSKPTDPATDPVTEVTDPATEVTDPVTEATDPATEATDPVTDPTTVVTDPITEPTEPDTVELNKSTLLLGVGEVYNLIKSSPTGTDLSTAVWSSSNTAVAGVSVAGGTVRAKAVGTAIITITTKNGAKASCTVTVKKAPSSISLNKTSLTMGIGETYDLNSSLPSGEGAYSIVYSSNNSTVASVKSAGGLVTANKVGTAVITATTYNNKKVSCTVTVKNAPTSVSLNKTSLTMTVGTTFDLNSSLPSGQAAHSIVYTSNNPKVASVKSAGGLVTANYAGTAVITATTYNGKKATCTVTVPVVNYNVNHTSKMVRDEINLMQKMYPNLIKVSSAGKSLKGKDITLVKMGFGSKKGFIYAGNHSREDLAVNFTLRSIAEYAKAYYSSSGKLGNYNVKSMLNNYTLYIIPCCNPDGLDICNGGEYPLFNFPGLSRGEYKGNARNVNINRNFPYGWYSAINGGIYGISNKGTSPGSEPETQAIMNVCKSNKFEWGMDIHIVSGGIYWRANHTGVIPNDYNFANKVSNASGISLFPSGYDEANYGGVFETWFRDAFNKPALCVELVPLNKVVSWSDYRLHAKNFDYCSEWSKTKYLFAGAMS